MHRLLAPFFCCFLLAGSVGAPIAAPAATSIADSWAGMVDFSGGKPLLFVIRISQTNAGLSATAESPYQRSGSTAVDSVSFKNGVLTFSIAKLGVTFSGTMSGETIAGTFAQKGTSVSLELMPSSIGTREMGGIWIGKLSTSAGSLLLGLHLVQNGNSLAATLDSPYQGAFGIAVATAGVANGSLILSIPQIGATYGGALSGSAISGTFTQRGTSLPLTFTRP
jgi:hypothetical protein